MVFAVLYKKVTPRKTRAGCIIKYLIFPTCKFTVQALKKKYVEQRLARSVVTNSMRPAASTSHNSKSVTSVGARSRAQEGVRTRSAHKLLPRRSAARTLTSDSAVKTSTSVVKVHSTTRKPSAATIVAKRKTRMATLTAASSRVSR